jgi:putative transposase
LTRLEEINEKISKVTFLRRVAREVDAETIRKRAGKKAAYQASTFTLVLRHDTPVHGDYPMQYVHIDHTELEIEVVSKKTGESLGRPYFTLIICAYSRRILGFYLSLRKPRYVSCMAALLDMIRRFGRAPEFVIFDGGSEFGAVDFKWMLRFIGSGEKPRKTSACREGDVIERMFGLSQAAFIHNLFGNTKLRTNPRGLTEETSPTNLARHTLEELFDGLGEYLFETYDTRRHGTLCMSPRQKFEIGLDRSGKRLGRIRRIKDCIPLAFPSVRGFTRKIDYQRGIHANHSQFRNPRIESPLYDGLSVPVKQHPIDRNIIYAYVEREWYPLLRVKSDADASSTDRLSLAEYEENLILHSKTLASQSEANQAVVEIVAEMDRLWADRPIKQGSEFDNSVPNDASQNSFKSNEANELDSQNEGSDDTSIEQQLRVLREGGYHGQMYHKG